VFRLIRSLKQAPSIHPSMNLELDLGISSLERVELLSAIEQAAGARIPEEVAARILSVAELVTAVETAARPSAFSLPEGPAAWSTILQAPLDAQAARMAQRALRPAPVREAFRYALALVVRMAAKALLRLRWQGLEHMPQAPFLLCPNHVSYIDPLVVVCVLPWRVSRRLFFLGDAALFSGRFMSLMAYLFKVVTVSQDLGVYAGLRLAAEGLRRGFVLCVFPEGERSIDGKLKPFRKGPALIATELSLPVVPVGIRGAWEVWPRGANRIRLHPVRVEFGRPLDAAGKSAEALNAELRQAVERLL
jgi:long-chain acyl-CoA synthetase